MISRALIAVGLDDSFFKAHYQLGLIHANLGNLSATTIELKVVGYLEHERKQRQRIALRLPESPPE